MIQESISKLAERQNLTRQEAHATMDEIMSGAATKAQIASFLTALRLKGETVEEITGCAEAMREKSIKVRSKHPVVIDTCGTGGDSSGTFNVSTTAALVAAGAGAIVAKHGNRAVSSRCGSADVLKALGVKVEDVPVKKVERCLDEVGFAFLFAPSLHTAMKYAAPVRKELGIRTIFNILGPLTNPAGASRQVVGVYDEKLTETMAAVLRELGSKHSLVVHGAGGVDEFSASGPTKVSEVSNGDLKTYTLNAADLGIVSGRLQELVGTDVVGNAEIVRSILNGEKGVRRDVVLLNAAAALFVAGLAKDYRDGIALAEDSIDSGKAKKKLADIIEATNA